MNKTIKKFTTTQKDVLTMLCEKEFANYYDVLHVNANYKIMKKLVDSGMVSKIDASCGGLKWKITFAGRFAKENEFCQKGMLDAAYLRLICKINKGTEFPDAVYHITTKYMVDQKILEKCMMRTFNENIGYKGVTS
jgi:hypothetical protein